LEFLLAHRRSWTTDYSEQLDGIRVIGGCGCGCPSLDFERRDAGKTFVISDVVGISPEGVLCGVLLWATEKDLHSIEIYSFGGGTHFSLPNPADLRIWEEWQEPETELDENGVVRVKRRSG